MEKVKEFFNFCKATSLEKMNKWLAETKATFSIMNWKEKLMSIALLIIFILSVLKIIFVGNLSMMILFLLSALSSGLALVDLFITPIKFDNIWKVLCIVSILVFAYFYLTPAFAVIIVMQCIWLFMDNFKNKF